MKAAISVDGRVTAVNGASGANLCEDASVCETEPGLYSVLYQGRSYEVRVTNSGGEWHAILGDRTYALDLLDARNASQRSNATLGHMHQDVKAPMPGKVVRMLIREGDQVQAGQGLAVVEAMKMQNELKALRTGRVVRVGAKDGDTVAAGDVLVTLE